MRHRVYGRHLGRNTDERNALFKSLVQSLFTYGTIETSEHKAKAVKGLIDRVVNLAKDKRTQPKLQSFLVDKNLRERLIKEIVPKLGKRVSGYTSIVRVGVRFGDSAMMVKMSLIGSEQLKPIEKAIVKSRQATDKKIKEVSEKKGGSGQSVRKTKVIKKSNSRRLSKKQK